MEEKIKELEEQVKKLTEERDGYKSMWQSSEKALEQAQKRIRVIADSVEALTKEYNNK